MGVSTRHKPISTTSEKVLGKAPDKTGKPSSVTPSSSNGKKAPSCSGKSSTSKKRKKPSCDSDQQSDKESDDEMTVPKMTKVEYAAFIQFQEDQKKRSTAQRCAAQKEMKVQQDLGQLFLTH